MTAAGLRPGVGRGSKERSLSQIPSSLPEAGLFRILRARIRLPRGSPRGCPVCPDRVAMLLLPAPLAPTRRTGRVHQATRYTGQRQRSQEGLWAERSEDVALRSTQGLAVPATQ